MKKVSSNLSADGTGNLKQSIVEFKGAAIADLLLES